MLGIGIFLAPVTMALHIDSVGVFFGVWIFTGLVALSGATAYAELGVLYPQSGGDYIFHREVLGDSTAFAYGWGLLSAGFAGSVAAMSVPLCTFQLKQLTGLDTSAIAWSGLGIELQWAQLCAVALIISLSLINILGVWLSSVFQVITSYLPLLLMIALSCMIFTLDFPEVSSTQTSSSWTLSGLTEAFLQAYFAYSGWNAIVYAAGEVENPKRNIPWAVVGGTLLVMAIYLCLCGAAVHSLQLNGLRDLAAIRGDIGTAMAQALSSRGVFTHTFGSVDPMIFINAVITVALVASINATILGGGRVALALAKDRCFWSGAAQLHPRWGTPAKALAAQAGISCLAVILIDWELIFSLVSLVMVVGGSLSVLSLYILRWRQPERPRSYKALGYPVFPALFICSGILVLFVKVRDAFQGQAGALHSLIGLFLVLTVFTVHFALKRWRASSSSRFTSE